MYTKWNYCNILNEDIGDGTKVGSYCELGADKIGENCIIEAFVFIPKGVTIGDRVFIGPGTVFTNDKYPPSHGTHWDKTIVEDDVVIGANCTILPGITIHAGAKIGAGSVVTKDVPEGTLVYGNPAKEH